jgi:hypothetical protein
LRVHSEQWLGLRYLRLLQGRRGGRRIEISGWKRRPWNVSQRVVCGTGRKT